MKTCNSKTCSCGHETKPRKVYQYLHHNNSVGSMLMLETVTDFALRSECVNTLAKEICLQIAFMNPSTIDDLTKSTYIKDSDKTISSLIRECSEKIQEDINIIDISYMGST